MQIGPIVLSISFVLAGCRTPEVQSELATQNSEGKVSWADRMGFEFKGDHQIEVTKVHKVSPACVMGLKQGDRIVSLNAQPVSNYRDFEKIAWGNIRGPFQPWCFKVERQGERKLLPRGCHFKEAIRKPSTRKFVCDPWNMRLCGPLSERCKDETTAQNQYRLY
jgi:membrane-associated protease RseP (regulator of RpoE activity)